MKRVLITFTGYSDSVTLQVSKAGIAKMDKNANFPAANPTPADMAIKASDYDAALAAAATKDKSAIAHKNALKKELAASLRGWAIYVNMVSNGNEEMLTSSGLPMAKVPEPSKMGVPQNLKVKQGLNPGSVELSCRATAYAKNYRFEWTRDPLTNSSIWEGKGFGKAAFIIENLVQGQKYWFRILAYGTRGQETISAEVSAFIL